MSKKKSGFKHSLFLAGSTILLACEADEGDPNEPVTGYNLEHFLVNAVGAMGSDEIHQLTDCLERVLLKIKPVGGTA